MAELRNELRAAQLTNTARLAMTARVRVANIRRLIEPTPEQNVALDHLALAFNRIHHAAKTVGPDPSSMRVREALETARQAINAAGVLLADAKPSEKIVELEI